jgi:hypothetical protein
MSDDILSEYGKDSGSMGQQPRATSGGVTSAKPLPYSPPVGPMNKTDVGKNGTNHGCCGTQGRY